MSHKHTYTHTLSNVPAIIGATWHAISRLQLNLLSQGKVVINRERRRQHTAWWDYYYGICDYVSRSVQLWEIFLFLLDLCITVLVHFLRHSSGRREIQIGIKPSESLISQRYFTAVFNGRRVRGICFCMTSGQRPLLL